jgi:ABC-type polysaccharide/polyol phosphate transport system ATPase subunit
MVKSRNKINHNNGEIVIKAEGLSKSFKVPHEKFTSLKSVALNIFKKKKYTEFKALQDVNFEIKKGEFFGIIGRNGSGKSTLLKILAGIYIPDKGNIEINGKLSPFLELGVGFNPELTARENVFLGGAILGLTRKEIADKFDAIIEFAELEEFIDMKFKNFSSGMQVRLAFSLAVNAHAEILLMDEVLAVGDSNFQAKCIDKFIEYKKENKTVILVSHDLMSISNYCDRTMLLEKGKVVLIEQPKKVIAKYYDSTVKDTDKKNVDKGDNKKDIYIESAKITSSKNEDKTHYDLFEEIKISLRYKVLKKKVNPVFGISIYNKAGVLLFATNTKEKNITIGNVKPGNYKLSFYFNNVFLDGVYTVSGAISDENIVRFYDWKDEVANFKVYTNLTNKGIIETESRIEIG